MPLELHCSACGKRLRAPDSAVGKRIRCPKCQNLIAVGGSSLQSAERWFMQTPDGQQFGPVPRPELDAWLGQGRITAECQLLLEGSPQWQWASEVYPVLAVQNQNAMPSFGGSSKRSSDSSGSGSFDFLAPEPTGGDTRRGHSGVTASDSFVAASGPQAVTDSIISGGSFIATSPSTVGRKSTGGKSTVSKKYRKKSGMVTAVAVVNYVMGGLQIFGGIVIMLLGLAGGAILADAINQAAKNDANFPGGGGSAVGGTVAVIIAIVGMIAILFGTTSVVAGYGVSQRKQWGRILTFVLGALQGINAIFSVLSLNPAGILSLAYCVFVFIALLQKEAAAEFR